MSRRRPEQLPIDFCPFCAGTGIAGLDHGGRSTLPRCGMGSSHRVERPEDEGCRCPACRARKTAKRPRALCWSRCQECRGTGQLAGAGWILEYRARNPLRGANEITHKVYNTLRTSDSDVSGLPLFARQLALV